MKNEERVHYNLHLSVLLLDLTHTMISELPLGPRDVLSVPATALAAMM